ncbi:hypothetical protein BS17DRAFT_805636 [Gyrodon lividus]|nr:hypothetical protein BS17DRAFT_805636 [Gyrodon lividus]
MKCVNSVEVLKKSLTKLRDQIGERKAKLELELKAGRPISEVDQDWLDGDGNLIDEERVVETLDSASDYEEGLNRLDSQGKTIVQKLQKLRGGGDNAPSKKQKRKTSKFPWFICPSSSGTPTPAGEKPLKSPMEPQKKENATLQQRIEILDWHNAHGRIQTKTTNHFHGIYPNLKIKQPLIPAWVKDEARWVCQTQHLEVTEMLELWVSKAMADNLLLTGDILRQKWKDFANLADRGLADKQNSGHIVPKTLTNIHVVNFEPNLTAHVQPNDQGIIRCFKAKYRAQFIHHAIHLYKTGVTPLQIYDINQLEAMRLAGTAWNEVDLMTIRNCWHKANILPNTNSSTSPSLIQPSIPISSLIHTADSCSSNNPGVVQAENAVHDALDDLQATGALQCSNQMDVAELLNPTAETYNIFDATDDNIYQAVMDAKAAWEASGEVNSNEVMVDNNEPVEPGPTRNEALRAALVLEKYINDFDDPFVRQLESMLGLVGKKTWVLEMQTMTDAKKLTSYFRPIQQCQ